MTVRPRRAPRGVSGERQLPQESFPDQEAFRVRDEMTAEVSVEMEMWRRYLLRLFDYLYNTKLHSFFFPREITFLEFSQAALS